MKNLLRNCDGSCYRVNDSVPFQNEWFDYLLSSPLPIYYSVISVCAYVNYLQLSKLIQLLSNEFALVLLNKFFSSSKVSLTIVTNKHLDEVTKFLNSIDFCNLVF